MLGGGLVVGLAAGLAAGLRAGFVAGLLGRVLVWPRGRGRGRARAESEPNGLAVIYAHQRVAGVAPPTAVVADELSV